MTTRQFSRRDALKSGAALAGAGALGNLSLFANAWANTNAWKPEKGAKLQILRWKRFVQSEEDAYMALVAAFSQATGVEVKVLNESLDDVQPKASVAANTGQGPDLFWGLYSLPHLFPNKCLDVTDVADYLGKKYGGWVPTAVTYGQSKGRWIALPVAYNGNVINYRQSMIEKAGFKSVPGDTAGFLEMMKALKAKSTPGGFALGRASGDGNAWVHWAMWAHGANLVDKKDNVVINSPETVKALEYIKALSETFVDGTASWNDAFNNKAFLQSQISVTNNGVSIYAAAKAGVAGMTRALARELGSRGITVNCVAPGFIETDMTASLPEEQQKALLGQIPLGHLGKPADIAHAVAYLAGANASYVTGQELHVNGGMFMA